MPKLTHTWKQTKKLYQNKRNNNRPNCSNKVKHNVSPVAEFERTCLIDDDDFCKAVDDAEKIECNFGVCTPKSETPSSIENVNEHVTNGEHTEQLNSKSRRKSKRLAEKNLPPVRVVTPLLNDPQLTSHKASLKTGVPSPDCTHNAVTDEQVQQTSSFLNLLYCGSGTVKSSTDKLLLSSWGIPDVVLRQYEAAGITNMFEWQAACLSLRKVLQGGNLVYSAPTSAGKTLVAELLMLKCVLERKKKAIMILPFVSVTYEKMNCLQKLLQPADVKVDGYMGNHSPTRGFSGVDIAICTIEKANSLVNRLIEENELGTLGIIVVDEFHMVGDPHRGYLLELLITKLRYVQKRSLEDATFLPAIPEPIQIIGMSATLPNLNLLADWIAGELFCTEFRPVPLNECLKVGSTIYGVTDSMKVLRKLGPVSCTQDDPDHVIQLCLETIADGHGVLVFCPTKGWCENLAESIAREIYELGRDSSPQERHGLFHLRDKLRAVFSAERLGDILELLRRSPAGLDKLLERTISFGVAFHHAGLTFDEREIIENAFRLGAVKVLTATSTLSSGVNLPARRVLIRTPMFHGALLNVLTYTQMIGRAGRKGLDEVGESILVCKESEKQKAIGLVRAQLPPVSSCLALGGPRTLSPCLKRAILEIIVSGIAVLARDVEQYVSCTLLAASVERGKLSAPETSGKKMLSADDLHTCLQFLIENEFIRLRLTNTEAIRDVCERVEGDGYVATPLGKAVLASCLSPDEGLVVFRELERARRCFVLESELHVVYQVTPIYLNEQWSNLDWRLYWKIWEELGPAMKRVGECVGVDERFLMRASHGAGLSRTNPRQDRVVTIHMRFYTALALHDLVNEMPLPIVANKYGCSRGMLQALQQSSGTFAGMVTVFCHHLGWTNLELLLAHFQNRLHFGIQQELCDLVRISCLNGQLARILYDGGYKTVATLANASVLDVGNTLKDCGPFESGKKKEDETDRDAMRRLKDFVWIPGLKNRVSVAVAAELIITEARELLQKDLGVDRIEWKNGKLSNSAVRQSDVNSAGVDKTILKLDGCASVVLPETNAMDKDRISKSAPDMSHVEVVVPGKTKMLSVDSDSQQLATTSNDCHTVPNTSKISLQFENLGSNVMVSAETGMQAAVESSSILEKLHISGGSETDDSLTVGINIEKDDLSLTNNSSSESSDFILTQQPQSSVCNASNAHPSSDKQVQMKQESVLPSEDVIRSEDPKDTATFADSLVITSQMIQVLDRNSPDESIWQTPRDASLFINDNTEHQTSSTSTKCSLSFGDISLLAADAQVSDSDSDRTPSLILTDESLSTDAFDKNISGVKSDISSSLTCLCQTPENAERQANSAKVLQAVNRQPQLRLSSSFEASPDSSSTSLPNEGTDNFMDDSVFNVVAISPDACNDPANHQVTALESLKCNKSNVINSTASPNDAAFSEDLFDAWDCNPSKPAKVMETSQPFTVGGGKSPTCNAENRDPSSPPKKLKLSGDLGHQKTKGMLDDVEDFDCIPPTPVQSIGSKISCNSFKSDSKSVQHLSSHTTQLHSDYKQACVQNAESIRRITRSLNDDGSKKIGHSTNYAKKPDLREEARGNNTKEFTFKSVSCSAINIVDLDVSNNRGEFEKFMQELRTKSKFSIAFACESRPPDVPAREIGHNVLYAETKPNASIKLNVPGIRLYDEDKIAVGLAICWDVPTAYYLNLSSFCSGKIGARESFCLIQSLLKSLLCVSVGVMGPAIVAFDLKEQYRALYHIFGYLPHNVIGQDPRIASWLLDPDFGKLTFYEIVEKFLPQQIHLLQGFYRINHLGSIGITSGTDSVQSRLYSTTEAILSFMLMDHLLDQLGVVGLISAFTEIEMPSVLPLVKMELNGFGFADEEYQRKAVLLKNKLAEIEKQAFALAGRKFCLSSVKEVSKVLFSELKLPLSGVVLDSESEQSPGPSLRTRRPFRGSASNMIKSLRSKGQQFQHTNKEVLNKLSKCHDLPKVVLEWRQIQSALDKIVLPMQKIKEYHPDLRMHRVYSYSSMYTATGRVTLSEPNIQMVPRDFEIESTASVSEPKSAVILPQIKLRHKPPTNEVISVRGRNRGDISQVAESRSKSKTVVSLRHAFIPFKEGILVAADYSQLELRILAHLSQDEALIHALNNGADVFKSIAAQWKGCKLEDVTCDERQQAKQICYGMVYGIGAKSLGNNLEVEEDEAQSFMTTFKSKYPGVQKFIQETVEKCKHLGYVETLMGRRRYLPTISSKSLQEQNHAERQAINTTVQGSAADIVKKAMIEIDRRLADEFPQTNIPLTKLLQKGQSYVTCKELYCGGFFVLYLHDELIYEVAEEDSVQVAQILKMNMEKAAHLSVKLTVKIQMGSSWGTLKEVDI